MFQHCIMPHDLPKEFNQRRMNYLYKHVCLKVSMTTTAVCYLASLQALVCAWEHQLQLGCHILLMCATKLTLQF